MKGLMMKGLVSLLVSVALLGGFHSHAYASDWDVAGKILTGIAGIRILSGGKVDILGALTGTGQDQGRQVIYQQRRYYTPSHPTYSHRIWVPHYVWKKKWVPEHIEYDEKLGEIIVPGHYVKYKVENGGHWEYTHKIKKHSRYR